MSFNMKNTHDKFEWNNCGAGEDPQRRRARTFLRHIFQAGLTFDRLQRTTFRQFSISAGSERRDGGWLPGWQMEAEWVLIGEIPLTPPTIHHLIAGPGYNDELKIMRASKRTKVQKIWIITFGPPPRQLHVLFSIPVFDGRRERERPINLVG